MADAGMDADIVGRVKRRERLAGEVGLAEVVAIGNIGARKGLDRKAVEIEFALSAETPVGQVDVEVAVEPHHVAIEAEKRNVGIAPERVYSSAERGAEVVCVGNAAIDLQAELLPERERDSAGDIPHVRVAEIIDVDVGIGGFDLAIDGGDCRLLALEAFLERRGSIGRERRRTHHSGYSNKCNIGD